MSLGVPDGKSLYEENIQGTSEEQLAERYNTTRSTVHGRIYRYKQSLEESETAKFDFDEEEKEEEDHGGYTAKEKCTREEEGNKAYAYSKSRTIRTLDGLIRASETDLSVWEVKHHIINKWDVTNKYGEVYTNWQVKAWFVRKKPIDIFPDIRPVVIPLETVEAPRAFSSNKRSISTLKRAMVISDPHFGYNKDPITQELIPYHDDRVLHIALQVFAENDFDYLIWGGDILDCNEWSTHFIKRPEFRQTTQPALNEAAKFLASFKRVKPDAVHVVLKGNHDDRIENYIISNLDEIYRLTPGDDPSSEPLMSISNLLGIKRLGIAYADRFVIGSTKFIHGDIARKGGGATARGHLENTISNTVFAHVHRRELVTETKQGYGDEILEVFSMCPGCVCFTDGRVPGSEEDDNWQNGFGVLEFWNDECISHQIIRVNGNKASYNGRMYWSN